MFRWHCGRLVVVVLCMLCLGGAMAGLVHSGLVWLGWWQLACVHSNVALVLQQFDVK